MKREKIFEFSIEKPLNATRRKSLEKNIEKNASLAPKDFEYGWDEDDDNLLHIVIDPVEIEISFLADKVELFATAPLWARVAFTQKRKAEVKQLVESVLTDSKFGPRA
ncbi:hypothetical protein ACFQI3_16325 [Hansschlegelia quercus]|uniref:Uncharacterized protein n=1 Tax=Hansschlegelia quercus TaxID=2528245 RepID=A0A4Q9GG96_9HYPH|nr:hypothetical protein [Hansschlegelia quercus]TBN52496.1 hypothetical protein EYR15_11725 [Hansschlegelia quercus]